MMAESEEEFLIVVNQIAIMKTILVLMKFTSTVLKTFWRRL